MDRDFIRSAIIDCRPRGEVTVPGSYRRSDLALIAGTVLATLAIQRHLSQNPARTSIASTETPSAIGPPAIGHGRFARGPGQIPSAGWKDILFRTYQQINEDRLLATAAGVVFYGLLAIFPAITALVSSYGLFADPSTVAANLQSLAVLLPEGSFTIVQEQIGRVLAKENTTLGLTFIFGLLFAIWSANAGMKAVLDALNVVYEEKEKRGFLKLNLVSLAFTMASLISILIMIGAVIAVPLLLTQLGLAQRAELIIRFGRWPVLLLFVISGLAILYRYGPSRATARWQWLSVGTIVAAALWLAGSALLSWYLSNYANYTATYGSLGAAIGLMTWMWMSAIIVLCGAELNAEIEHQTTVDSTEGRAKPLGARGAKMADTVGRAA
jgi:membrane protein